MKITAIALTVYKEAIRDKIVVILIFAFILILAFFHIMGKVSINGDRLIQTAGLYCFGIFGILCNIYLSINFIQEINSKRFFLILVRPVSAFQFVSGKCLGMCILLLNIFFLMSVIWIVLLMSNNIKINPLYALTLMFIFAEWMIIAFASLFFSLFTTPLVQSLIVTAFYFVGHHSYDIYLYSQTKNIQAIMKNILTGIYYVIPDLELLNFRYSLIYNEIISFEQISHALLITLAWLFVFFTASYIVFYMKRAIYA
ncbi:membrane hypothetical protein [Desulfamplus magnetovallimortis]|uniref:Uncharacterized protein n=1 Tax=Desulfamplus magnetovallimortis TaxID=1246637 RepID=A0A1W1HKW9_9BACT|nr:hypothetical protein [Desulfamplus magnetovallimortis]SLM33157.1 membrane hypothetical protein [Desulfamplus magnetovallimortis]